MVNPNNRGIGNFGFLNIKNPRSKLGQGFKKSHPMGNRFSARRNKWGTMPGCSGTDCCGSSPCNC
jgi:hypothetical protein